MLSARLQNKNLPGDDQRQTCREHRSRPRTAHSARTPCRCHQSGKYHCRRTSDSKAYLPALRGSHDHRRALRARLNSAPPANSANASDQDRYLVIMSTQSPSLNAGHFVVAARLNTSQARANSLFVHQFSLNHRLRRSKMITAAPAPCVTPCNLSTSRVALPIDEVARSPLKSP